MNYIETLFGHSIELRSCGTGSCDPWSLDYARSINLGLMCTTDCANFMLIDCNEIYKFDRNNDVQELYQMISNCIFDSWDMFTDQWLKDKIEKQRIDYLGTLEDSKKGLDESKKRDNVWKSIPKDKRTEVYKYLKTLSDEDRKKWYQDKIKELENN